MMKRIINEDFLSCLDDLSPEGQRYYLGEDDPEYEPMSRYGEFEEEYEIDSRMDYGYLEDDEDLLREMVEKY